MCIISQVSYVSIETGVLFVVVVFSFFFYNIIDNFSHTKYRIDIYFFFLYILAKN